MSLREEAHIRRNGVVHGPTWTTWGPEWLSSPTPEPAEVPTVDTQEDYVPTPRESKSLQLAETCDDPAGVVILRLSGRPYKAAGISEIAQAYNSQSRSVRDHNQRCGVVYEDT